MMDDHGELTIELLIITGIELCGIKQKQSKLRGTKNSESLQPEYECMWFRQKETSSSSLPHKNSWGLFGFLSWFSKIEIRGSRLHTGICMKTIQALQALWFGVPIPISFFIVFCPSSDSFLYILPNFTINFWHRNLVWVCS